MTLTLHFGPMTVYVEGTFETPDDWDMAYVLGPNNSKVSIMPLILALGLQATDNFDTIVEYQSRIDKDIEKERMQWIYSDDDLDSSDDYNWIR